MLKKLTVIFIVASALCCSLIVFAAPDTIYSSDIGNSSNLIAISNPDAQYSSTFDKSYVISGYGNEGVRVYLYIGSGNGTYYLQKYDGIPVSWTIGASGLFMRQIKLSKGINYILLRAEASYGSYQNTKRNITQLNQSFLDIIKSFTFDIMNFR